MVMIHQNTVFGINGKEYPSMARLVIVSIPLKRMYRFSFAVINRKTTDNVSEQIMARIYHMAPQQKPTRNKILNKIVVAVLSIPSKA